MRATYRARLEVRRAALTAFARDYGWSYLSHRTDQPAEAALLALYTRLAGREAER